MIQVSEHRLVSFDETPVFYRRIRAASPKTSCLIIHGMGEHGGRYVELASFLAEKGIDCWIPDLRGFGKSGGPRGHADRFEDLKRDVAALAALASRENPWPHFYLGHSFGGLIAASAAADGQDRKLRGLALSSPLFGLALPVPAWKGVFGRAASLVLPRFAQKNGVDPATLTHDPSKLQEHASDPLIHDRITPRLYTEMSEAMLKSGVYASRIRVPVLVLQAGDDRVVSKEKTLTFYERLVTSDRELEVYPGFYHEVINEVKRQAVYNRIRDWIIKHI